MAVCYNGDGSIVLKQDFTKEFSDKFTKLAIPFDEKMSFMCNDKGLLQFMIYARHYFVWELIELLEENVEMIDSGRLWFSCYDEDSMCDDEGFPFIIFIEIKDGKVYNQSLNKRLPEEWMFYNTDQEWFDNERNKKEKEEQELMEKIEEERKNQSQIEMKQSDNNDDGLPF